MTSKVIQIIDKDRGEEKQIQQYNTRQTITIVAIIVIDVVITVEVAGGGGKDRQTQINDVDRQDIGGEEPRDSLVIDRQIQVHTDRQVLDEEVGR